MDESKAKFYPNSTQFPNVFFDEIMALLDSDEWKVLSYIVRRTYGFLKEIDIISIKQLREGIIKKDGTYLDRGTGLPDRRIYKALDGLRKANIVYRIRTGRYNKYGLTLIRGSEDEAIQIDWEYLHNRLRKREDKAAKVAARARQGKID